MAYLIDPIENDEVKKTPVVQLRNHYIKVADSYRKLINREIKFCAICGRPLSKMNFYTDRRWSDGLSIVCRDCLKKIAEQRKNDDDEPNETRQSIRRALKMLDKPFINSVYDSAARTASMDRCNKTNTIFPNMVQQLSSLPQYIHKTYKDSDPDEEFIDEEKIINEDSEIIKNAKKHFGTQYSFEDLKYLETQYADWTRRYEINQKAQEVLLNRICCKQLELEYAQHAHKDTSKLDKDLQDLMSSLNVKPSQNSSSEASSGRTFGQLIDLWENERPIPKPEKEFGDPDHMIYLVDGFFRGHLAKMMGLKNGFSALYEKLMSKYRVERNADTDESDDDTIFNKIFNSSTENAKEDAVEE